MQRAQQPRTILVISRDTTYLKMMRSFLSSKGYQPCMSQEWIAAYDQICHEQPALVVLDLWLEHPQAGEMFLGMLRVDPRTQRIPVIACTPDVHVFRQQTEALAHDTCSSVLLKPLDFAALFNTIERLVVRCRE